MTADVISREITTAIPIGSEHLIAICQRPEQPATVGVVIVAGGPQYRVGANRQNVKLARHLASVGIASVRFDCRGKGDATGDHPGFEMLGPDIRAAIDWLHRVNPGVERIFLWGLCDGASAIVLNLPQFKDLVAGLILLNPWARSEQGLAKAQLDHYLSWRALSRQFLRKLVRGQVNPISKMREIGGILRRSRVANGDAQDLPVRLRQALLNARVPSLIVLARDDATGIEFRAMVLGKIRGGGNHRDVHIIQDADHTFSDPSKWSLVQALATDWVLRH